MLSRTSSRVSSPVSLSVRSSASAHLLTRSNPAVSSRELRTPHVSDTRRHCTAPGRSRDGNAGGAAKAPVPYAPARDDSKGTAGQRLLKLLLKRPHTQTPHPSR